MNEPTRVVVPLINPNETEVLLADLHVKEGQRVSKGDLIASFETTKSTFELTAERDGYVVGLNRRMGETLHVGELLCHLTDTLDQPIPLKIQKEEKEHPQGTVPHGLRITQPALVLAKKHGIDPNTLPIDVLITEKYIIGLTEKSVVKIDTGKVIIYGGGGHAKSLIDLIRAEGKYQVLGILDDGIPAGTRILEVPVLGGGELMPSFRNQGIGQAVNAVGGIGSITPRLNVFHKIADTGLVCVTVIHPRAFVEPTAKVGEGCQLFFNAYVGSDVRIGYGCIVNTGAIISHDCVLCDYVNISPGAILAGAVSVGERTLIGMGVTINLGVKIGAGSRIGNSAVVKTDVPENGIVRAGTIWPPNEFK